jgi:hypothetical protein
MLLLLAASALSPVAPCGNAVDFDAAVTSGSKAVDADLAAMAGFSAAG